MAIDRSAAKAEYEARASSAGDKLVRKYLARNDKLARASSEDAQKAYESAMQDPNVLKRRQSKLKKLTEEDLNRAMSQKGAAAYANAVANSGDKWAQNAEPFLNEIERIQGSLKPRTRDPVANVQNRVLPFAKGLHDLKNKRG